MPHLATAVLARKFYEALCSFEADCLVAEVAKNFQIAPGPAPKIEDSQWPFT